LYLNGESRRTEMVYPKQVVWKGTSSAHGAPARPNPQRELVAASLLKAARREERWDERTRTVHQVRAA
jgi:hypothetical protein